MIYDPILDPKVKRIRNDITEGNAVWIWYPGQRVAHLHKAKLKESQRRFRYIGYPGTFRQPEYITYFKTQINLSEAEVITWCVPDGRFRLTIDGRELDITDRQVTLDAGNHELYGVLDFTDTLPCLSMNGEHQLLSGAEWQVSLDGKHWCQPEYLECFNDVELLPLAETSDTLEIMAKSIETLDNGYLLVDFGYYELGHVRLKARGKGSLQIIVGQSKEEVLVKDLSDLEQIQSHEVAIDDEWSVQWSMKQALRYALIRRIGQIEVEDMTFRASVWPVTYHGNFKSEDEHLNACWDAGAATIHSCMQEFYLDAIYRDALPWALDGVCAMEAGNLVFSDKRIGRQHLMSQLLPMGSGASDLGSVYLDFQLHTLLGVSYDYMYWKDEAFIRQVWPIYQSTLEIYCTLLNVDGFLDPKTLPGTHFFPDWAVKDAIGPDCYGVPSYVQMLLMACFDFGAYLALLLGVDEAARKYDELSINLRKNIYDHFYDQSSGLFINGYLASGEKDKRVTMFAQVFAVMYDLYPKERYDDLALALKQGKVLRHESISLNYYFELQALCRIGQADMALDSIRQHVGNILQWGDVRVYEDIKRSGERCLDFYGRPFGKSLCHSIMGAAPVITLSREIFGIKSVRAPGFNYYFDPSKTSLDHVEGTVATPVGTIKVTISTNIAFLTLPEGIEMTLEDHWRCGEDSMVTGPGRYELRRVE